MKLIVLDRDGVINEDRSDYVKSADEWVALPGSLEAIARLCNAGWKVVIATNQSGIGRNIFSIQDFIEMQQKMDLQLKNLGGHIDAVFFCPHRPDEECRCRKPSPGLFEQIIQHYKISDPSPIPAVGDSQRDIKAASKAGFAVHLVLTGNGRKTREALKDADIPVSKNLEDFVTKLLAQETS